MLGRAGCGIGIVLLAIACGKAGEPGAKKNKGPKEAVNLPAPPNLDIRPAAEKYQDGTLSVEGFLRHAREMLGKPAAVRGQILAVNSCPKDRELCEVVPHAILVDDLSNPRRKMFVVSDPPAFIVDAYATKSTQTLSGTVSLWSPDGRMVNLDGVLVVAKPVEKPEEKADEKPAPKKKG